MNKKALLSLITAMTIFGTCGVIKHYIHLPSGFIAMSRSIIGFLFLILFTYLTGHKLSFRSIKENIFKLVISGFSLAMNWILFFESINKTGVSIATVCYYFAPIIIIAASPFFFKEKITIQKIICIVISVIGIILISGIFDNSVKPDIVGIIFGLIAAVLYAVIVMLNKSMNGISNHDRVTVQFGISFVVLTVYTLLFEKVSIKSIGIKETVLLIVLGIVHTGTAYMMYFYSMRYLSSQVMSIFSYIDPVVALFASLFIGEKLSGMQIVGAVFVIFSTVIFEINLPMKGKIKC